VAKEPRVRDTWWNRFGFWLDRFEFTHPLLLRPLRTTSVRGWPMYENRLNRHLVAKPGRGQR
jgi:hypothetical protein